MSDVAPSDFDFFAERASRASAAPVDVARAARALVDGAIRIRRGGDGLYGEVAKPNVKQAEAIGVWIKSMERDMERGNFHRAAEMREALIAAGEEVDLATKAEPKALRLRDALWTDAITVLGSSGSSNNLPWFIAAAAVGLAIGLWLRRR